MDIGIIGLGRMGGNMARRLRRGDHRVVAWTRDAAKVGEIVAETGAEGATSLEDVCKKLPAPRVVWSMVPSGEPTAQVIGELGKHLASGDIVIDGGNSHYRESMSRATALARQGIEMLDCGTSGGVWGLEKGYCLMVGGAAPAFKHVTPILETLAPPDGFARVGPSGAGHFVKMVHNGIEYALMQAYGEGFELMKESPFAIDLARVARLWMQGSVVRSWLLELAGDALEKNPELEGIKGWVADSGEGRWTVLDAVESAVATPTIALALFARFASRKEDAFGLRLLAALRDEFGGHGVKRDDDSKEGAG